MALLSGCNTQPAAPVAAAQEKGTANAARPASRPLEFSGPVFIDSSAYVLYPLVLQAGEDGEDGYGSFSKGRGRSETYWNIAFYNPGTGNTYLLAEGRKLLIESYGAPESGSESESYTAPLGGPAGGAVAAGGQLYYTVRTDDFNRDGVLNDKDPGYLFVSDRAGRHFRQLSPPGYHVHSWHVVPGTSKVLLRATPATADNRHFDETSHDVPFVYDLQTDAPAQQVFGPAFQNSLRQQLNTQWPVPAE